MDCFETYSAFTQKASQIFCGSKKTITPTLKKKCRIFTAEVDSVSMNNFSISLTIGIYYSIIIL
jgi:hypothetical protein